MLTPFASRFPLASPLDIYHPEMPWELFTDTYSLTMPQGWHHAGMMHRRAAFYAHFRKLPEGVGNLVLGGTDILADWIGRVRFNDPTLHWMSTLKSKRGYRMFNDPFLESIRGRRLTLNLDSFSEGSLVFPHPPLIRGEGALWELAFIEGALLNLTNQYTTVMSTASRMAFAAGGQPIADNSLRRGRGVGGSIETAIGAFRGGIVRTSNMLASRLFGLDVSGTMAHCFVGSFKREILAFLAFAEASPGNTVFLVDTYGTIRGIRNAIKVALELKKRGRHCEAIRLDSGDLAELSKQGRKLLDEAGLQDVLIIATNSLTDRIITALKEQTAPIVIWASGDALANPGLGGIVWKLCAVEDDDGSMRGVMKQSETPAKTSVPGEITTHRFYDAQGVMLGDAITHRGWTLKGSNPALIAIDDYARRIRFDDVVRSEDMLVPLVRDGRPLFPVHDHAMVQKTVLANVNALPAPYRRQLNPHHYSVGLESSVADNRFKLTRQAQDGEFSE